MRGLCEGYAVKILFVGDVVGEPGRKILVRAAPLLRARFDLDLFIVNAENAAGGSGLNTASYRQLVAAGVDAFTMGDHIYRHKDIYHLFRSRPPICRPANLPSEAPGPDHALVEAREGVPVVVISLLGRLYMKPVDCPFHAVDRVLQSLGDAAKVILVDIHAEATAEKQCMLYHLRGRVSAVLGTHTHVPTADARVFPPGTAFMTDVGMTGPYGGVIGRKADQVLYATFSGKPTYFEVATAEPRVSGAVVEVDPATGAALAIEPVHWDEATLAQIAQSLPPPLETP